ncbi:MAG: hypothetical protein JNJ83_23525 [Verrucomicrobiaceae bacterium]|nr:hypothetical protein [Verrucomicrobiaceae bacterium]
MNAPSALVLMAVLAGKFVVDVPDAEPIAVVNDLTEPFLLSHELNVNSFLGAPGFGLSRTLPTTIPNLHGSLERSALGFWSDGTESDYSVVTYDLVGIAVSPAPRVYALQEQTTRQYYAKATETQKASTRETQIVAVLPKDSGEFITRGGQKVPTRSLDEFERSALKQLQSGHALCYRRTGNVVRGLGAIRAMQSCLRCHEDAKEGDLMGAFTYHVSVYPTKRSEQSKKLRSAVARGASNQELWHLCGYKGTPRNDSAKWLHLRLASFGIVLPEAVTATLQERQDLEQKHSTTNKEELHYWRESDKNATRVPWARKLKN